MLWDAFRSAPCALGVRAFLSRREVVFLGSLGPGLVSSVQMCPTGEFGRTGPKSPEVEAEPAFSAIAEGLFG